MATRHEQCGCSFGIAMYNAGAALCWNNMRNVLCSDTFYFFVDINLKNTSAFLLFFDRNEKANGGVQYVLYVLYVLLVLWRRSTPPQASQKRADPVYDTQPARNYEWYIRTDHRHPSYVGRGERGRVSEDVYSPLAT
jgi:hypothetical protein